MKPATPLSAVETGLLQRVAALEQNNAVLQKEKAEALEDNKVLRMKVQKLERMLWQPKSERSAADDGQGKLFADAPAAATADLEKGEKKQQRGGRAARKGPRELDPTLRREQILLPAPDPKELFCAETRSLRQPAFTEYLEVLARKPAEYYVKVYERTVFTSSAKTAPVTTPWPADVLPRARMHASVVAHIACAHYADHQPFFRLEQQLERVGVHLPRSTQVSLMDQLAALVDPMVEHLCREIMREGYVQLDATPMGLADPARPGKLQESALWAYRSVRSGKVWFEYRPTKAIGGPNKTLCKYDYQGLLQTDAAAGLNNIGPPGQIRHLGCHAHLRRPFFKAVDGGDRAAARYLAVINGLFEVDRRAKDTGLNHAQRQALREKESLPAFRAMVAWARTDLVMATPKTEWAEGLGYLLKYHDSLERCLTEPVAELSNNGAENAIRPLKLGANYAKRSVMETGGHARSRKQTGLSIITELRGTP